MDLDKAAIPYWVNWLLVAYLAVHAFTHTVLSVIVARNQVVDLVMLTPLFST